MHLIDILRHHLAVCSLKYQGKDSIQKNYNSAQIQNLMKTCSVFDCICESDSIVSDMLNALDIHVQKSAGIYLIEPHLLKVSANILSE